MDDLVLLVKHQCPLQLIADTVRMAAIFDSTASDYGFVVQYGAGKTEAVMALRGANRMAAVKVLQDAEHGDGISRQPCLQIAHGKWLRVVRGYKHLGAVTNASLRFGAEAAARAHAASQAEARLSRGLLRQSRFSKVVRVNTASAVSASLLYAAALWPKLSLVQFAEVSDTLLQSYS
jgi:hypothetical protein